MKICFFCVECEYEEPRALSEITWDEGGIGCRKGHWHKYSSFDLLDVGKELARAESCEDYKPAKGCKQ